MAAAVAKICDPGLYALDEAIRFAQSSAKTSPGFEVNLARFLQAECQSNQASMPTLFRGLEILGGILCGGGSDERRLVALLRPFLRSSNPQIASKSILVLGRQSSSMEWVNTVMSETDDRVRANLIEALWRRKEPEVELVLRTALNDIHPRVAANAVYGLYLLGADAWVGGLERLINSGNPTFRISGIWVLKSCGLPDAAARLKLHIRDPDPEVRRAAFDALKHLRDRGSKKTAVTPDPALAFVERRRADPGAAA